MNYVQEELLRQERVLTVLLSGQRTARREEAPPERAEADPGSTAIREPDAPTRAAARAGTQQAGVRVGASRAAPAELDGTPEGSVAGVPPGRETVTRRTGGRAGRGAPAAAWSSGIPQPGVPGWRGTASGGLPGAGGVSVEALSRAIHRDARRSDGGFTLY